ncbi:unnamed protein product [Protopolystoma xenopodis]|uniref:Uncharacterized protein n=1 Tax=Protopolystoma xenopodis TaxID=117903 RepID=A0A3S5AST4_9PLAT|nr:unnamed protein product [Protopolystoma xenopodis]
MFGDASLSPEARAARAASLASSWRCSVLTFEMVVGPDLPGAFNVGGPEGAASRSCAEALAIDMINGHTSTGVDHFAHSLRQAVAPMTPSGAMTAVAGSSIRDCGEQRQQHYNGLYDDTAIQDVREQVVAGQIVTKMEAVDYMFSTGTEHKRQILLDS